MQRVNRTRALAVWSLLLVLTVSVVFTESAAAQTFSFGGIVFGTPSCVNGAAMLTEPEVVCVIRGSNNDLYSIRIDPLTGATLGFQILGFTNSIAGNPSCGASARANPTLAICAVRGLENELYGIVFDPLTMASTGLHRLESSGPTRPLAGDPSCVSFGALNAGLGIAQLTCGVRGKDNGLYVARLTGTAQQILSASISRPDPDDVIVGEPSCALASADVICAARAANSSLAVLNTTSGGFRYLDGPPPLILGDPSCAGTEIELRFIGAAGVALRASPLITCGVRGTDGVLYAIRFGIDRSGTIITEQPSLGFDVVAYRPLGALSRAIQAVRARRPRW